MKSLNNTGVTIPDGFRWLCEETKKWVPARGSMHSYTDFIGECKRHCLANHLPIGLEWEKKIQDQLCVGLDGAWCNENGYPVPPVGEWGFNISQVIEKTRSLAHKMIVSKTRRVPSDEATQRAAICIDCPFNQAPIGCTTCNSESLKSATNTVEGASQDLRLKSCKVAGMSIRAAINVPLQIIRESLSQNQMSALPARCWIP